MDIFKGKVRRILANGKRVQVARSHSVCEIDNFIQDIKIGDTVICQWGKTIRKIDKEQATLNKY